MRSLPVVLATALLAGVLFLVPLRLVDPPPICALTSLVSGLLAFWCFRELRLATLGVAFLLGGLVGAAVHAWSHWSEDRVEEGFVAHLVEDAALGLALGAGVLAIVVVVGARIARPRPTP